MSVPHFEKIDTPVKLLKAHAERTRAVANRLRKRNAEITRELDENALAISQLDEEAVAFAAAAEKMEVSDDTE